MMLSAACTPRRAAESLLLGDQFLLIANVPYDSGGRQRLDIYRLREERAPVPVVVFLYGGRWQYGSKEQYRLLGDAFTREGVVAVVPDYRLYPEVGFPGWVEDAAHAVRWVYDSIARYGGDPARIFIVGHSAGGHTATLLDLDDRFLKMAGVPAGTVRGVVSMAGPVATTWTDADVQTLMGPRDGWPATYPRSYVNATSPPLLLLHGERDRTVAAANSTRLADLIRGSGGCARAITYRGLGHVGIAVALSLPRLPIAPVMDDVMRFVKRPGPTLGC